MRTPVRIFHPELGFNLRDVRRVAEPWPWSTWFAPERASFSLP